MSFRWVWISLDIEAISTYLNLSKLIYLVLESSDA